MKDPNGVNIDFEKIEQRKRIGVANGALMVQLQISRRIRAELSQPGTGRLYRIGVGKLRARNLREQGLHRASAPGRPPAVDTGRLRQSWTLGGNPDQKFAVRGPLFGEQRSTTQDSAQVTSTVSRNRIRFTYGSNLKYARVLEFGSRRGRLAPRPYVRPTVSWAMAHGRKIMQIEIRKAMAMP